MGAARWSRVRYIVAVALGNTDNPSAIAPLIDRLEREPVEKIRLLVVGSLLQMAQPDTPSHDLRPAEWRAFRAN